MDQVHPRNLIKTKRITSAKVVVLPAVKEQIFTAFVRERQGRRRLAKTCGGSAAIDEVLREGILDMQEQGAMPRFRDGFGKPIRREVVSMPARVKGVAA